MYVTVRDGAEFISPRQVQDLAVPHPGLDDGTFAYIHLARATPSRRQVVIRASMYSDQVSCAWQHTLSQVWPV